MKIFSLDGWNEDNFKMDYIDSDLKVLEIKAEWFHNQVKDINSVLLKTKYVIDTAITGDEKENKYKLSVKIEYYGSKQEHEHKENTHIQEINI